MAATSTLPATGNNEVLNATPGANGVAVFDVTAAQLAAIPSYQINLNGATSVIFNVSGSSLNWNANYESSDAADTKIIWNFYQATSLTFNTLIGGTVLAPDAAVTNNNQIDGTLVANSWTGQGELHEYGFTGTLPTSTTTVAVPEPAALVLLIGGLLVVWRMRAHKSRS